MLLKLDAECVACRDAKGREPFNKWFQDLDARAAAKVQSALAQLDAGNTSEVKPVGGGISERRIHWGKVCVFTSGRTE